jgi:preprotein translocase subunit SecB
MGVTASGLRYPEPSEPVAQGAANIKALADDVTTKYAKVYGAQANLTTNASGNAQVVHTAAKVFASIALTMTVATANNGKVMVMHAAATAGYFTVTLLNATTGAIVPNAACQFNWIGI